MMIYLRYRKWPFGMGSEVFWRSGDGTGEGGFGGSPPFEGATSTPGAGVGGLRGPPHSKKQHPPKACGDGHWSGALPRRSLSVCPLQGELSKMAIRNGE